MTTPPPDSSPADGFIARVTARMEGGAAAPEPAPAPAAEPEPEPAAVEPAPAADPIEAIQPEIDEPEPDAMGLPIDKPVEEVEDDAKPEEGEEDLDPKARHAWKAVRTELKEVKAARTAAETKLAELEARLAEREATTPELTELQTKVAEYEKLLSVTRLESSPAYIKAVEEPYQNVISKADEIADRYEIDKIELSKAIAIADRKERSEKLKDLLVGVDDDDRLEVRELAREVEKIAAKQQELVTNADKALAELEAEAEKAKAAEIATRAEERKKTVAQVLPYMTKKLPSFGPQIDALSSKLADTDLASRPVTNQVYDAAAGELLPIVIADRNKTLRALQDALDELEKFKRATPGSGSGGSFKADGKVSSSKTFSEAVAERLAQAGA